MLNILKNTYEGNTRSRTGRDLLNNDEYNSGKQGPSKRQLRVSNLVQIDLQEIIHEGYTIKTKDEIEDKLRKKISVVEVDVSPDLAQAKVFISVYGETFEKREAYIWLVKNTKKIRHALVQKMKGMKRVPEIRFKQTDLSKGVDMYVLLENLEEERIENEMKRKETEQRVYMDKKKRQQQLKKRVNKIDYEGLEIVGDPSTINPSNSNISAKNQNANQVETTKLTTSTTNTIFKKGTIKEEDIDRILGSFSNADSLDWGDEKEEDIEENDLAIYDLEDLEKAYIEELSEENDEKENENINDEDEDDDDEDFDWVDEDEDDYSEGEDEDEDEEDDNDDEEWEDLDDDEDDYETEQRMNKNKKRQDLGRKPRISVGGEEFAEEQEEKWIM